MPKYLTFKLNKDFRRLYGCGKCIVCPSVVIYYRKNYLNICRIGITASKKIGGAVKRNRAKRVIRAAFGEILPVIDGGYDFIFVARTKTVYVKSSSVYRAFYKSLLKEGVISKNGESADLGNKEISKTGISD